MKLLYTVFIALSFLSGNAQNIDSIGAELVNVLKLKHAYEASLQSSKRKTQHTDWLKKDIYKKSHDYAVAYSEYMQAINVIIESKKRYRVYLENVVSSDVSNFESRFVVYDYESPLSSIHNKNNHLTLLSYYKIFRHFIIDLNKTTLPPLKEALSFINNQ